MAEKKIGYSREDWQRHYDENDLGWDLGQVAPPFVSLFENNIIVPGKTLVPGCGRGHEADQGQRHGQVAPLLLQKGKHWGGRSLGRLASRGTQDGLVLSR